MQIWGDRTDQLMKYLQCRYGNKHHSFVFIGDELPFLTGDGWFGRGDECTRVPSCVWYVWLLSLDAGGKFSGNGFDFDAKNPRAPFGEHGPFHARAFLAEIYSH